MIGQDSAVQAISDAIRRNKSGLSDIGRPLGSFIFLGPTGVGKTELAKTLADFLFNDEKSLTRIDMSEYMEKFAVSRLVGAPPGYVGYEEGGQLTEAVRRRPYSVVLFDEIEKAHPDVFNILLQLLDDGRLTDSQGRVVDFRNAIIIMTSNLGSEIILENGSGEETNARLMELMKRTFKPEFLNRVDDIISFNSLGEEHIRRIVNLLTGHLAERLKEKKMALTVTDNAASWLAHEGYDPAFGARPLRRAVQNLLQNPLSRHLLAGDFTEGDEILCDLEGDGLVFPESLNRTGNRGSGLTAEIGEGEGQNDIVPKLILSVTVFRQDTDILKNPLIPLENNLCITDNIDPAHGQVKGDAPFGKFSQSFIFQGESDRQRKSCCHRS